VRLDGWLLAAPIAIVFAVGALYGFTALGDSPVRSTALTETVGASHLGAALALRSFLGFGAGAVAQIVFGRLLDLTTLLARRRPRGDGRSWRWEAAGSWPRIARGGWPPTGSGSCARRRRSM